MAAQMSNVDALLEREARQLNSARDCATPIPTSRLNAVWRQKVIHWYFTLVSALGRQHASTAPPSNNANPFNRASVHVSASLLDNYLMSLPSERALRYKHDRTAYQLLATTCLLLGMRLAQHDQAKESRKREAVGNEDQQVGAGGLKRAKTHRTNMNRASATPESTATPASGTSAVAIPNASTILRISAAPKAISEQDVLAVVRDITGARSFPRSKVVTALDFVDALCATSTHVSEDGIHISLGPEEAEEASRLIDTLLRDVTFLSYRPSVVACAAITFALLRSDHVNMDMASLRQRVCHSIFGPQDDAALQANILKVESNIHVGVPSSRNNARRVVPTAHLIPLEEE